MTAVDLHCCLGHLGRPTHEHLTQHVCAIDIGLSQWLPVCQAIVASTVALNYISVAMLSHFGYNLCMASFVYTVFLLHRLLLFHFFLLEIYHLFLWILNYLRHYILLNFTCLLFSIYVSLVL